MSYTITCYLYIVLITYIGYCLNNINNILYKYITNIVYVYMYIVNMLHRISYSICVILSINYILCRD